MGVGKCVCDVAGFGPLWVTEGIVAHVFVVTCSNLVSASASGVGIVHVTVGDP